MSASMELNKVAGAVLTAGVVAMTAGFVAKLAIHPTHPEQHAYVVELPEGGATATVDTGPTLDPVLPLLAAADVAAGEKAAKKCVACHTFDQGGANKIGPNLWETVNRSIGTVDGFGFSSALQGMAADTWTYENLNAFIAKPKDFAPGTKMTYAGMKKVSDRANLIAYLRSMSGSPAALPTQEEIDAVTGAGDAAEPGASEEPAAEGTEQKSEAEPAAEPTPEPAMATETDSAAAEPTAAEPAAAEPAAAEPAAAEPTAAEPAAAASEEAATAESASAATAAESSSVQQAAMPAVQPIGERLASADPAAGEAIAKACRICHTFEKDGAAKVGPNLYNVVGGSVARSIDFNYSKGLRAMSAETWSYENLDIWLTKPQDFAKGTRMAFRGLNDPTERAAVIAFLRLQHDNPPALR